MDCHQRQQDEHQRNQRRQIVPEHGLNCGSASCSRHYYHLDGFAEYTGANLVADSIGNANATGSPQLQTPVAINLPLLGPVGDIASTPARGPKTSLLLVLTPLFDEPQRQR